MTQILDFCVEDKTFQEILDFVGLKDRVSFKRIYIDPLIIAGELRMTDKDNPKSRNQRYVTVKKV